MYAIIMPVVMGPALIALIYFENRAKKQGLLTPSALGPATSKKDTETGSDNAQDPENKEAKAVAISTEYDEPRLTFAQKAFKIWQEMDAFGLLLLGFGWTLLLLPFSLSVNADNGYKNPSLIAMFVVGGICLIAYCVYEAVWAKFPTAPIRLLKNRTFITAVIVGGSLSRPDFSLRNG